MKRINWERVSKIEYSARKAALKQPNTHIGKEMIFLLDTIGLLKCQVTSLQNRVNSTMIPTTKKDVLDAVKKEHIDGCSN
jgi:hypothetical protein